MAYDDVHTDAAETWSSHRPAENNTFITPWSPLFSRMTVQQTRANLRELQPTTQTILRTMLRKACGLPFTVEWISSNADSDVYWIYNEYMKNVGQQEDSDVPQTASAFMERVLLLYPWIARHANGFYIDPVPPATGHSKGMQLVLSSTVQCILLTHEISVGSRIMIALRQAARSYGLLALVAASVCAAAVFLKYT